MGLRVIVIILGILLIFNCTTMKYTPGDIYSVDDGGGEIGIVKVLAIEPGVIHLMIYKNKFSNRPKTVDLKQLSLGKLGDEDGFGIGHIPLDIEGFKNWKPQLIANEPVTEDELVGYNIWRESQ